MSFELAGGFAHATRVVDRVQLCRLVEHVGSVETLLTHSASMTHAALPGMIDFIGYMWVTRDEDGQHRRMLIEPDEKFIAGQRVDPLVEAYGPVITIKNQKHPELGGADFADIMEAIQI